MARSMMGLNLTAFTGVVIMVTMTPWRATSLAKSVKGMIWLWDIKGTKRK